MSNLETALTYVETAIVAHCEALKDAVGDDVEKAIDRVYGLLGPHGAIEDHVTAKAEETAPAPEPNAADVA